jgi:hypothetical protein
MSSPTPVMPQARVLVRRGRAALGLRARRPRPHFLGIGTQKGGTTTLYQLLKPHPEVFLPDNKEVHYFTKHYAAGEEWYVEQFEAAAPGQLRGEITPYYLFHEAAPERIHALRPDMRLIALLRDPVERTLSQYFHSRRLGLEDLPLELALAAEAERLAGSEAVIRQPGGTHQSHQEHSYLARSRYEEQLLRYFNLFGRQNVLVLRSEDLFEQPQASLEALSSFLGIRPFANDLAVPRANRGAGESSDVDQAMREHLAKQLAPTYAWLERELGLSWPTKGR